MKRSMVIFIGALIVALLPAMSLATNVTLNFDTLPSEQGWIFWGSGIETEIFSVSEGVLHQNSIGIDDPISCRYEFRDINPDLPFVVTVRARVLEYEGVYPWGFSFGVVTGTENSAIGIGMTTIEGIVEGGPYGYVNVLLTNEIDTTQFHDYRLEGTPHVGWELYVDDVLIGSGTPGKLSFRNTLFLGDGTGGANAKAEVMSYSFYQPVPIPVTVDIKPGVYPNTIIWGSKGTIQVAILTTPEFDAATVDPVTVTFDGVTKATKSRTMDVDSDGNPDLLLYFTTQALNLNTDSEEATLTGETYDGVNITGTDSVTIVTKGKKK